jgi:hypothetical protein
MREFVLFLAFCACKGDGKYGSDSVSVLNRAQTLITITLMCYLVVPLLVLSKLVRGWVNVGSEIFYIGLLLLFIIFNYLCKIFFSRRILARSLRLYGDHWLGKHAKLIVFGIVFISICICAYASLSVL